MAQVARSLTGWDGELRDAKYLIHDRDTKYTAQVDTIMNTAGIQTLKFPAMSSNLNAFAERWVKSVKVEVLDKQVLFGKKAFTVYAERVCQSFSSGTKSSRLKQYHSIPGSRSRECLWKDQNQRATWRTAEVLLPSSGVTDFRLSSLFIPVRSGWTIIVWSCKLKQKNHAKSQNCLINLPVTRKIPWNI
ncbi:MAG: hypothetical protein WCV67_00175 [Victivallaceae bacterium]|jgi:hypothetical protein